MAYTQVFTDIQVGDILTWVSGCKREGWQFVQLLACMAQNGVDVVYTLRRDNTVLHATVHDIAPDQHIPSITGTYMAAFVFENEIHDLFGVQVDGIAIDYKGKFYQLAVDKPMTIMSPEQVAAREKAKKLAAAAAAKAAKAAKAVEVAETTEAVAEAPAEATVAAESAEATEEVGHE